MGRGIGPGAKRRARLRVSRQASARSSATARLHKDVDPKSKPVYDLKLPSIDTWRFDSDAEGWTTGDISDVHNDWGALVGASTTADPTMTSPVTYLDCSKYAKAHIRMMASAYAPKIPPGGPDAPAANRSDRPAVLVDDRARRRRSLSVTFKVQLDSKWHDYELDLTSNPNWKGLTDRLRFDPVDVAGVIISMD